VSLSLPSSCRVVVIGGGVIGTSVAYHLSKLGWTDLVLLEQGKLSGGTTWHAAGLVGQLRATRSGTRLVQYSTQLYSELCDEVGLDTGFKRCGGVTVARTRDRMVQLERTAATAEAYDLECEIISAARAAELYPIMQIEDLVGGIWLPGDGTANPTDLTSALARGARLRGARVVEGARVVGMSRTASTVTGVEVQIGEDRVQVECEVVVNCAGQWAKAVGALCDVTVPLHSAEHFYAVTDQIAGVHRDLPILRDPDGYTYFKEEVGGLVVGGFEPHAKPWVAPDAIPYPFEFQLLNEDWDQFSILMSNALHRIPALQHTGIKKLYNGPESFTPDNQFLLGPAPGVTNFYLGAGFNSVGIASAGGAGRALAEWIVNGEPTTDLSTVDIRRFAGFNGNNQWLHDRVGEVLGLHYEVPWPNRELSTARPFRRSPIHHLLSEAGAVFGSKMGWERPNFFAAGAEAKALDYTWDKPDWLRFSAAEQVATRTGVAVFDQTSFGKLLVVGPDAEAALQWLCAGDVAVPAGRAVYTPILNDRGGYLADVTVTRLAADRYLLVTGAGSVVSDCAYLTENIPTGLNAQVVDVSSAYAVFGVMGPKARALLQTLTRTNLDNESYRFSDSREIDLGYATVRATRITYVGELGWELYVPSEFAVGVYEQLTEAGTAYGLLPAGYYAINSLRLEKGYRAFGSDLTPDDSPVEAGLLFATKLDSSIDFRGRAALAALRQIGARRRLVSFVADDPEVMMWGGELLMRDGVAAGQVTSAAWGATLGASVGLGYVQGVDGAVVDVDYLDSGSYEIAVGAQRCPVTVSRRAPYDPTSARVRD
jgi:4-methylaminobutanoate oxidase (formaldehyde-forming)